MDGLQVFKMSNKLVVGKMKGLVPCVGGGVNVVIIGHALTRDCCSIGGCECVVQRSVDFFGGPLCFHTDNINLVKIYDFKLSVN